MKLDSMRRRLAAIERLAGSGVVVVLAGAPDLEQQRARARELGLTLIVVDREDDEPNAGVQVSNLQPIRP